jgi:hypothetical protein
VKLTDTQLRLLAAASQRDDRALERPSNLTGGAAGKVVAKLLTEGLVEEIQSRGSSPVWRRDGDVAHTLRITKRGLQGRAACRRIDRCGRCREPLRLRDRRASYGSALQRALRPNIHQTSWCRIFSDAVRV